MIHDQIARAIDAAFISPNVSDSNMEAANIVDAVDRLATVMAYGLKHLGNADASTPMGALEAHGKAILDASENIAGAIHELAEAIREHR